MKRIAMWAIGDKIEIVIGTAEIKADQDPPTIVFIEGGGDLEGVTVFNGMQAQAFLMAHYAELDPKQVEFSLKTIATLPYAYRTNVPDPIPMDRATAEVTFTAIVYEGLRRGAKSTSEGRIYARDPGENTH